MGFVPTANEFLAQTDKPEGEPEGRKQEPANRVLFDQAACQEQETPTPIKNLDYRAAKG